MPDPVRISGDATPFLVEVRGTTALVVAGQLEHDIAAVQVNGRRCAMGAVGWISEPLPMKPGMTLEIVWLDPRGVPVRTIEAGPLEPDALEPIFGSEWVTYGPPIE